MKKIIFLAVILAVGMVSCQDKQERIEEGQVEEKEVGTELKLFIDECKNAVPNAGDNKIAMRKLQDTIKYRLESKIGDTLDFVYNYPMKIKKYIECIPGRTGVYGSKVKDTGKYIVIFRDSYIKNMALNLPNFQIMAIIDSDSVEKLVDDGMYKLQGTFKGFVKEFWIPQKEESFTDSPAIHKIGKYTLDISLGTMVFENIKIEPFIEE